MLVDQGWDVLGSVTTSSAQRLFANAVQEIHVGHFTLDTLIEYLMSREPDLIVDATHPFAVHISKTAMIVCRQRDIPYVRYERPSLTEAFAKNNFVWVSDLETAASHCMKLPGNCLVATGVKVLEPFLDEELRARTFFRFLKTELAVAICKKYRLAPENIWWDEPNPPKEAVEKFLRHHRIRNAVVKDSGPQGISLALAQICPQTGVCLFILERTKLDYPVVCHNARQLEEHIKRLHQAVSHGQRIS